MEFGVFIVLVSVVYTQGEPCDNYSPFPNEERRDVNYELGESDSPINDRYITEGWYGSYLEIASAPPGISKCGTLYPIWAKEEVTNVNGTLTVTMCIQVQKECEHPFTVQAINCETHKVYYLKQTPLDSSYCLNSAANVPQFSNSPSVHLDLIKDGQHSEYSFICNFEKSAKNLFYKIYWYIDNKFFCTSASYLWQNHDQNNKLNETTLVKKGITSVGFYVSCGVRASYKEDSAGSKLTLSKSRYVGIKLLTTRISLKPGDTDEVKFQLTAPFGCFSKKPCSLEVTLLKNTQINACEGEIIKPSNCVQEVNSKDWKKIYSLSVKMKNNVKSVEKNNSTMTLKLGTGTFLSHNMWSNCNSLGTVIVETHKDTRMLEGKTCYAWCDPHVLTFDGKYYENQYQGTFTLYTNTKYKTEVQIETSYCGFYGFCVCGIAIRAGRSVFVIQRCHGLRRLEFTLCDDVDDVLDVRKKNNADYQVLIPTGTLVQIYVQTKLINVYITPSVHDIENSRGLCGKFSNSRADDFVLRDETQSTLDSQFISSWRVDNENNLFQSENYRQLENWDSAKSYCSCKNCSKPPCTEIVCGPKQEVTNCRKDQPNHVVVPNQKRCRIHAIKKRSVKQSKYTPNLNTVTVEKREAKAWRNGWTNESATEYCEKHLNSLPSVQLSKNIPEVNVINSIRACVFDIWATGNTTFVYAAVDAIETFIREMVVMNSTYQQKEEDGESLLDQVFKVTCPSGCSGHGICINGSCECNENFSGPDCSVDLLSPPVISEVDFGGLCDLNEDSCTEITLFGDTFVDSPNAICKFRGVKEKEYDVSDASNTHSVTACVENIFQINCGFPVLRNKRSVLGAPAVDDPLAYLVSVSNNGVVYSEESIVVIYNSTCQTCKIVNSAVQCTVAEDYCTVRGQCIQKGGRFPYSNCLVCDIRGDKKSWQEDLTDPACGAAFPFVQWCVMIISVVIIFVF